LIELCGFIESVSRKSDNWLWIYVDNFTQGKKTPARLSPWPVWIGRTLSSRHSFTRKMRPSRIAKAACWAHAGRKLFELADIVSKAHSQKPTAISPIAFEAGDQNV
jgi:hypothetical protein